MSSSSPVLLCGFVDPELGVSVESHEGQAEPGNIICRQATQGLLIEEPAAAGTWLTNPMRNPIAFGVSLEIVATPGAA
ncbi:MAG: hypothetical protein ABI613_11665 [Gemmatimonadota bacterium]